MAWLVLIIFLISPLSSQAMRSEDEIAVLQKATSGWAVGEKIAFWAEQFLGTSYDPDPLGAYVRERKIVFDTQVDCMYLTFRAVELSIAKDPQEAVRVALDKRFIAIGKMEDNRVTNYETRFRYGEDMIDSGKWGREITSVLGTPAMVTGTRGRDSVAILPMSEIRKNSNLLMNGDILFFINPPKRMIAGEMVGHIGIIKKEKETIYLVHAHGHKNKGGSVTKVLLNDYIETMPFLGIRVIRFGANNPAP